MLSIEKYRRLLDNESLSDDEIAELLSSIYQMATVLVDRFLERNTKNEA